MNAISTIYASNVFDGGRVAFSKGIVSSCGRQQVTRSEVQNIVPMNQHDEQGKARGLMSHVRSVNHEPAVIRGAPAC